MPKADRKVIVVTGISRGIGRVMIERFSALGHAVAGCARNAEKLNNLAAHLTEPHLLRAFDVRDETAVKSFAEAVLEQFGAPDLLVNNAALMNKPAPLWTVPREEFDSLIDVNVKGVVNMIRHFVPHMVERKKGVIVNLSSGWGRSTSPEVAPYCATKYAVEGLSKSLAEELPKGMACIPLNPGMIDTDMLRDAWEAGANESPTPEEWANKAVPFILKLGARDNGKSLSIN